MGSLFLNNSDKYNNLIYLKILNLFTPAKIPFSNKNSFAGLKDVDTCCQGPSFNPSQNEMHKRSRE